MIIGFLAAAIAAGSGAFAPSVSKANAKAMASAVLEQAALLRNSVQMLVNSGCTDTQISFQNDVISGYTNNSSPSDKSCHVFDPSGGHISFPTIRMSTLETADNGYFVFTGQATLTGAWNQTSGKPSVLRHSGTSLADLVAYLPIDDQKVCEEINTALGLNGLMGWDWYHITSKFMGTYSTRNGLVDDGGSWTANPQPMGCLREGYVGVAWSRPTGEVAPRNAPYFFYALLLAR